MVKQTPWGETRESVVTAVYRKTFLDIAAGATGGTTNICSPVTLLSFLVSLGAVCTSTFSVAITEALLLLLLLLLSASSSLPTLFEGTQL